MATLRKEAIETRPCRYGPVSFFKNDTMISRSLKEYGEWAQAEIEFLLDLIDPSDTVLDIGAFIGTHTLAFAKHVIGGGKVYVFEAQPAFFEVLKKNVEQNALRNVRLFDVALSDDVKQVEIDETDVRNARNFGATSIFEARSTTSGATVRHFIKVTTVDQFAIDRCDLIKIDAENMEINILKGARQTLRATRPVVFAECNSLRYGWPAIEFMKEEGYYTYLLNVEAYNSHNFRQNQDNFFGGARETSLVFIPAKRLSLIQDRLRRHPSLIPIACLDDLALGLLKKPQYKYEVMAKSEAANVVGVGFWANETEAEQLRGDAKTLQCEASRMREQVAILEAEVATIVQKEQRVTQLVAELERCTQEAARLRASMETRQHELESIYRSLGWKIVTGFRRVMDRLLPARTWRRKLYDRIIVALKSSATGRCDDSTKANKRSGIV
jgi:FkbM family methyltransferase